MENNFDLFCIEKDRSVKEAMKLLDKNQNNILYVVTDGKFLLGSLTDGDIRRWILSGESIEENVGKACFKQTFFVNKPFDEEDLKNNILEKKINSVPVLDSNGQILKVLFRDDVFGSVIKQVKKQLCVPVVIMAGGFGSRLEPFTKVLPKPLIPIGDKTITEVIIDKFVEYGINEFYLSLFHKSKIIKSYFEELNPDYKIKYIYEDKPLGTVGCIKFIENHFTGDFFLTNCDIIIDADYADLLEFHQKHGYDLTLVGSMMHYKIPYGICDIEQDGKLIEIREKPEYSFLISTGMYVLKSEIISLIPENELYHITHLMDKIKSNGGKIGVYPISENSWVDTGNWIEYKKTVEKFNL